MSTPAPAGQVRSRGEKGNAALPQDRKALLERIIRLYDRLEKARDEQETLRGEVGTLKRQVAKLQDTVAKLQYEARERQRELAGRTEKLRDFAKRYNFLNHRSIECDTLLAQTRQENWALRQELKALQGKAAPGSTPGKSK